MAPVVVRNGHPFLKTTARTAFRLRLKGRSGRVARGRPADVEWVRFRMDEDAQKSARHYTFDRHGNEYRLRFEEMAADMQDKCPVAWNDTYGGHWFAAG